MRDAGCPGIVTAGFCQRIERELAEALEQLAAMTDQRDAALMTIRMMERRYEEED